MHQCSIIKMEFADPKTSSVSLLPTDGQEETNLMKILFTKIKPTHPEFVLKYEGYDQDVRISLSPSVFHGPMDPVISVWSFLMTTFAPEGNKTDAELESDELEPGDIRLVTSKPNRVRVGMNLTKVQGILFSFILIKLSLTHVHPVLLDLDKNTPYQLKNVCSSSHTKRLAHAHCLPNSYEKNQWSKLSAFFCREESSCIAQSVASKNHREVGTYCTFFWHSFRTATRAHLSNEQCRQSGAALAPIKVHTKLFGISALFDIHQWSY